MKRDLVRRREFLATASSKLLMAGTIPLVGRGRVAGAASLASPAENNWLLQSQSMPEPPVALPTDNIRPPGSRKRLAAITTAYFKYSHADDIITKFIEGYAVVGRIHRPHCEVVSLYVEQFPPTDIGRGMAARYGIPLFHAPAAALTLGGDDLAVDGVLLIGEHGDYPTNEKGQKLYPRRRLFEEIVKVFRATGKSVPVFNDKHLSYSWKNAKWMYDRSRELGFSLMAGSSVPTTWRRPPLELRPGAPLEAALAVGYGGIESYGFHTLECLQVFTERRRGGETGVRAVQCLQGADAWKAGREGRWRRDLLDAALATVSQKRGKLPAADPDAVVFLIEYADGLEAACYLSRGHVTEFAFAAKVDGVPQPAGTWFYLPKPQRDHFSFLCNHIEKMFLTGKPSYKVERTYVTTGMLAALMDSHFSGGKRIETPELANLRYQPAEA